MKNLIYSLAVLVCLLAQLKGIAQTQDGNSSRLESFFNYPARYHSAKADQSYFLILKFDQLPTSMKHRTLQQKNIKLQNYLGNNRFVASMPTTIQRNDFKTLGIIDIQNISLEDKISASVAERNYPDWVLNGNDRIRIAVIFYEGLEEGKISTILNNFDFRSTSESLKNGTILIGNITEDKITTLAAHPMVAYVDLQQAPDQMLNYENRCLQNITSISSSLVGGKDLNGEGVCIGVGDGGELGNHLDFVNRVSYSVEGSYASFGDHGDHVAGIIGAAGLVNPRHKGIAPKASLLIEKTSRVTTYLEDYFNDYGMVITNNSYGTNFDCATNGSYNYSSLNLDKQMLDFPEALHVFAAGNSGGGTCAPYPIGYKTVLKFYQSAKNVLTVGVVDENKVVWSSSSRGPVLDGRLKPEICGVGKYVYSTGDNYNYNKKSGSSMASPAVAATLGLMYEQYRKSNNGNNPTGALMKAIACNTAEDLGNKGPDYIYGYGLINGRRAVKTIEEGKYISGTIATSDIITNTITVPAGTKQLKVMLYWHDKEAEAYPDKALVNDLDLELKNPSNVSYLPWILNPDAANVADLAVRGVDTLNNIEQITIDNPQGGNYEIKIKGSSIPFGPQAYHIVYEFVESEIVVTHPFGGEVLEPNVTEKIIWDTDATNTEKFTASYSINGGASWTVIDDDIPPTARMIDWVVPGVFSDKALIKIAKNGTSIEDTSNGEFTIIRTPYDLEASERCEGYLKLEWNANGQSTAFEILHFDGTEFVPIATTTEKSYVIDNNYTIGERQWFAIKGISNTGAYSTRTIAVSAIPEVGGICPWEDDIKLKSVEVEKIGRAFTSTALSSQEQVFANVTNIGENTVNLFELNFLINDVDLIQQNISFPFNSGDSLQVNLSQGLDLSAAGTYQINAWTKLNGDIHNDNDSIIGQLKAVQLDNPVITLPKRYEFTDGVSNSYPAAVMGIEGLESWDFETNGFGALEVDANLGEIAILPTSEVDMSNSSLLLTMNLSSYSIATDDIKVKFDYKFAAATAPMPGDPNNRVWVRGSDQDTWIELLELESTEDLSAITISKVGLTIQNFGQDFSSSTQFRFSQGGFFGLTVSGFNVELETASLPVELSYFKAHKSEEDAWLIWKTVSEIEHAYFEVQMAEGESHLQDKNFRTIGQVPSVGSISSEQVYEFWDREPNKRGIRYYRLKQVDLDGSYVYSEKRAIDFGEPVIVEEDQVVYPNPFYDELRLKYSSAKKETLYLVLCDMQGREFQQLYLPVEMGYNDINIDVIKTIPAGMYHLKLISSSDTGVKQKSFNIIKKQL